MDVKKIRIEDFDYTLPEERIAQHPLQDRDKCKLILAGTTGKISHHIFSDLPFLLKPETLIVANETKVIRARMEFHKSTGARIEIFLLEPISPADYASNFASDSQCVWGCLVGNRKKWKEGTLEKLLFIDGKEIKLIAAIEGETDKGEVKINFSWNHHEFSFAQIVEAAGSIPIPPYLNRKSEESDSSDYQTVYSRVEGSVAAPTAGLHFTPELIADLRRKNDKFSTVTLHVGAGTFQPVKADEIGDHPMHTEWMSVSRTTIKQIIKALEVGDDILAVGTTSVRTLESLPYLAAILAERGDLEDAVITQWMPYDEKYKDIDTLASLRFILKYLDRHNLEAVEANTYIMIAPGFRWRIVNKLITNFHQPKSTLLLLVSSFLGKDELDAPLWKAVYNEALASDYRFLSYGDACLFTRGKQSIRLPLAKSMLLRAVTIDVVRNLDRANLNYTLAPLCDDVVYYIEGLKKLLESRNHAEFTEVYIGEGAAPLRFFIALASSIPDCHVKVTCSEGLRKRPIRPLIDTLISLGADINFSEIEENWFVEIRGKQIKGGKVSVDTSFTSQYLSALLLVSPLWENGIIIEREKPMVSKPYFRMTEMMMSEESPKAEPDWSAAAFFYEYCFISQKPLDIENLVNPSCSLQGDSSVCDLFSSVGVSSKFHNDGSCTLLYDEEGLAVVKAMGKFEYDFSSCPDLVPAVAVAMCYRRIPFHFHGIGHLRYKECDRLTALQTLLYKLGYEVSATADTLQFNGEFKPFREFPVEIDPYGDHRIAMAFYPFEMLGMALIEDKEVVAKSFPNFYTQFK